jgi:hypothetical protein
MTKKVPTLWWLQNPFLHTKTPIQVQNFKMSKVELYLFKCGAPYILKKQWTKHLRATNNFWFNSKFTTPP